MEESIIPIVREIVEHIQGTTTESLLMKEAKAASDSPFLRVSELRNSIHAGLVRQGHGRRLQNFVYQYLQVYDKPPHPLASPEHKKEALTFMRKAQNTWDKRIAKSLNSMCTELSIPLARKRGEKEQRDVQLKWTELGASAPDLSSFRPVYAPKDFLDVLANVRNPNANIGDILSHSAMWGLIQVPLKIKTVHELRLQFSEMSINQCQAGVDDLPQIPPELFEQERTNIAKKILSNGQGALCQEFAKKGCPLSLRGQMWCHILNIELELVDRLYFEQLKGYVIQHDLLVDSLIYKDVKLTATNDDQYFVFEDYLYQVLLPFSRDTKILAHFAHTSATPPKSYIRGKLGLEDYAVTYPPNGVIPFHGFSMYVAPLCYIYNDPVQLYFVFKELYTKYFFRLHSISSHSQSIFSLCLLFESLLQTHEPELFKHLKSVGAQPLKTAFKWLIRAFSGYLESEQVLLLWDRILAYNSLEVVAVLAVAIFSFRKTNLMQAVTPTAVEAVLADITTLKVVPLIQLCLFSKGTT